MARTPIPQMPGQSPQSPVAGRGVFAAQRGVADAASEDYQLTRQLVTGDSAAWRTLVERFQRLVLARTIATARELNRPLSQADAEDLCAEVFSTLIADDYAALKRFEGRSTLSTWLCVITRRIVLRRLPANREPSPRTAQSPPLETLSDPASDDPSALVIHKEDRALLAAGLAQLGERHQQLARLFYLEGRSYRQISQQLNIPVNSIGPTLARIHEKLRVAMKQREP